MNANIFREYDIRGKVGQELTPHMVEAIGQAFGTMVMREGFRTVTCGRDGRTHSEGLQRHLMAGMKKIGLEVIDIGLSPTPLR